MHNGLAGFFVSLFFAPLPDASLTDPIEIGIRQLQQISVIGLTNLPEHVKLASLVTGIHIPMISKSFFIINFFEPWSFSLVAFARAFNTISNNCYSLILSPVSISLVYISSLLDS